MNTLIYVFLAVCAAFAPIIPLAYVGVESRDASPTMFYLTAVLAAGWLVLAIAVAVSFYPICMRLLS